MSLRSDLGRVRGLGSAKSGTSHWRWQRFTALALVPLGLWFVSAMIALVGAPYDEVVAWVQRPLITTLLLASVVTLFAHAVLGLQVIIEDYVHHELAHITLQILMRFGAALCALLALVAIFKVSLG